ncbi:MAG: hypothetical protein HY696_03370 [Deltaproteobacteria bacterium]|nr:hypothetical protein [Deltaproteobacteria bacterium]
MGQQEQNITRRRNTERHWQQLSIEDKRRQLRDELQDEMITMAHELGLQLSVDQIIRAIEQTEYTPDEMENRHTAHLSWLHRHASQLVRRDNSAH